MVAKGSEPTDLKVVYICMGVIFGMVCLVLWASSLVRNGIIQYLMKMQVKNTTKPGNRTSMRLLYRQSCFQDTEIYPREGANSCARTQSVSWTRDQEEEPRRDPLTRKQPIMRTKPQHDCNQTD